MTPEFEREASVIFRDGKLYAKTGKLLGYKRTPAGKYAAREANVSRASTKYVRNSAGILVPIGSNIAPIEYIDGREALFPESSATNGIRNNTMQGAAIGTAGSIPTNWSVIAAELSREVVDVSTENGIEYITLRYFGTSSASNLYLFFDIPGVSTAPGNTHNISAWLSRQGPNLPNNFGFGFEERSSGGGYLAEGFTLLSVNNFFERKNISRPVTNASTAFIRPYLRCFLNNGSSYDFTIKIGLPQAELGSIATSPIKTSGSTASRNADDISYTSTQDINTPQGTVFMLVNVSQTGTKTVFNLSNNSLNESIRLRVSPTSVALTVTIGGSSTTKIINGSFSGLVAIALSYANLDYTISINGSHTNYTDMGLPASLSRLDIGKRVNNTDYFNDHIIELAVVKTAKTPAELNELTA